MMRPHLPHTVALLPFPEFRLRLVAGGVAGEEAIATRIVAALRNAEERIAVCHVPGTVRCVHLYDMGTLSL